MAIAHRGTGTFDASSGDVVPNIPAGTVAGDMMLCLTGGKPFDATFGGLVAPGWTQLSSFTDGTVAAGVDTGSMLVTCFWKEHDGSEVDPVMDESATGWNIWWAVVMSFSKDGGETWDTPVNVGGGDGTAGTDFSVTCGSNPGVTTGDHCVSMATFRSDAATPCSSHITPTQTGVTFSNTHDPATDPETTTSGDLGACVTRSTVSGTGSAAPVLSATLAAAHTGSAQFIRLRIVAAGPTLLNRPRRYPSWPRPRPDGMFR